jgi:hypothetical protein
MHMRAHQRTRAREAKPMPCCTAASIRQGKPDASKTRQNGLQAFLTPSPMSPLQKNTYELLRIFEGIP